MEVSHEQDELLDTQAAAVFLKTKPGTLEVWRSTKRYDLAYVKVGHLVRYRRSALEAFLRAHTHAGKEAA